MAAETSKGKRRKIVHYSLLLSLLLHALFLLQRLDIPKNKNTALAKKKERPLRIVIKKAKKKRQVVASEQTGRKSPPKDEAFLGKADQTHDRQTVARQIDTFKTAGKGVSDGHKNPSQKKDAAPPQPPRQSRKSARQGKGIRFADLALTKDNFLPKRRQEAAPPLGQQNGAEQKRSLAQNNDFVEDVPLGDATNLNTVEFKYYGFYQRIKRKLEQYWGKSLQAKAAAMYRSGRRLPASAIKMTSLVITLDAKGNIVRILIKSTSGVQEFDNVAVESFNKAGPFPNPPKGMIKNGWANIEWGFVVKS